MARGVDLKSKLEFYRAVAAFFNETFVAYQARSFVILDHKFDREMRVAFYYGEPGFKSVTLKVDNARNASAAASKGGRAVGGGRTELALVERCIHAVRKIGEYVEFPNGAGSVRAVAVLNYWDSALDVNLTTVSHFIHTAHLGGGICVIGGED